MPAHDRHQDGEDIIPAPAEGCPATVEQAAGGEQQTQTEQEQSQSTIVAGSSGRATPRSVRPAATRVLGAHATSPAMRTAGAGDELGVAQTTGSRGVAGLPFTGLELTIVAALGAAALLAGFALRRSLGSEAGR